LRGRDREGAHTKTRASLPLPTALTISTLMLRSIAQRCVSKHEATLMPVRCRLILRDAAFGDQDEAERARFIS
jgi:hypothetical protein